MQSPMPHPELHGWQRFVGRWATQATHPVLSGAVVRGHATFEWLDGRQFLILRWHYDHPEIPDAIAIIGIADGQLSMHYFDHRGVYRVYAVSLVEDQWRFWRDVPGFSQRFTGVLSDDGDTITGQGQLSRDGAGWEDDLAITYRRTPPLSGPLTGGHPDLNAMARRVIDASHYAPASARSVPVIYATFGNWQSPTVEPRNMPMGAFFVLRNLLWTRWNGKFAKAGGTDQFSDGGGEGP
jgi:hypothetical protein